MIEIKNLTKYYGKLLAVNNLSLNINKGEVFGFIGPNGAGKSTTIRCIMNLLNISSGEIYIDGKINDKDDTTIKQIIGYLPSEINLYEEMKVIDMINYSSSFYKENLENRIKELINILKIDIDKKIEDLSFGNKKKVGILLALMHNPKILILDEATNGLDPLMQEEFYKILLEEKKKGTTIFYSTHNLTEVKRICDRVGIIKEGSLINVSNVSDLNKGNIYIITITSSYISSLNIVNNIIEKRDNTIKFLYNGNINELINIVSKVNIDKITIEEPSIEELFMHYYK